MSSNPSDPNDQTSPDTRQTHEQRWLEALDDYLEEHYMQLDLKIATIAYDLSVSERTLRERLISYTGLRPKQYLKKKRIHKARQLLTAGYTGKLHQLARQVGFSTKAQFRNAYEAQYGQLPDYLD